MTRMSRSTETEESRIRNLLEWMRVETAKMVFREEERSMMEAEQRLFQQSKVEEFTLRVLLQSSFWRTRV